jgi:putative endonuclease
VKADRDRGWGADLSTRDRGLRGEDFVADWLEARGWTITARNADTPVGEIDIVANDHGTLVFVEVKARRNTDHGPAIAAVGADKQRRLARAAAYWLLDHPWKGECRFDVVGLEPGANGWNVVHIPNAFEAIHR